MSGNVAESVAKPFTVVAVHRSAAHDFVKPRCPEITLLAGLGVLGDAHLGVTVQHRSRVRKDPTQPNLRQVHLIHAELFAEVAEAGFEVGPGELGENVTTAGIDLLGLPTGALLQLGHQAVIEVTGLRNPCHQIDGLHQGLLRQVLGKAADGSVIRKAGVMAVVRTGGVVRAGDPVRVTLPPTPHQPLHVV